MKFPEINTLTEDKESKFVQSLMDDYRIDSSYQDFADVLYKIAVNCDFCLRYVPECLDDEISRKSAEYLRDILKSCADMMLNCDPSYRAE